MRSTEDEAILHAILLARCQQLLAGDTGEAVEVEDAVTCPHDQLARLNARLTARAALLPEPPACTRVT